jgi:hypothetical protein
MALATLPSQGFTQQLCWCYRWQETKRDRGGVAHNAMSHISKKVIRNGTDTHTGKGKP